MCIVSYHRIVSQQNTPLTVSYLLRCSDDSESSHDHDDEVGDEGEEDNGLRRSRRATKGRRFAYWKGERPIYESGTMVGLQPVEPTPMKKKNKKRKIDRTIEKEKEVEKKRNRMHKMSKGKKTVVEEEEEEEQGNRQDVPMEEELQVDDDDDVQGDAMDDFVVVDVPSSNKYVDRSDNSKFIVWNEYERSEVMMQVVRTTEFSQPMMQLQKGIMRPPERDQVGFACHVFNVDEVPGTLSGWLSGE